MYCPNPVPLSSRSLLASALLFDRLHFPGVCLPQARFGYDEKQEVLREIEQIPLLSGEHQATRNLSRWATEIYTLGDFIYLPDKGPNAFSLDSLFEHGNNLVDDTYGEGTSDSILMVSAAQGMLPLPALDAPVTMVLTWPLYQARAVRYAYAKRLPLVSDDARLLPPLPRHPAAKGRTTSLAQQLAVEALALFMPRFKSVTPVQVANFRGEVQAIVQPFRLEMVRLTSELHLAIASGTSDQEIVQLVVVSPKAGFSPPRSSLRRNSRNRACGDSGRETETLPESGIRKAPMRVELMM